MRMNQMAALLLIVGGLMGCTPGAAGAARPVVISEPTAGMTVRATIATGFKTKAAAMTAGDISYFQVELVDTSTWQTVADGTPTSSTVAIQNVPDGTYVMTVTAFSQDGKPISQGGAVQSVNEVTVEAPSVSYSDGSQSLQVDLDLLNGTGEDLEATITVHDGQPYQGSPDVTGQTM
jgi:hypothetical protein